MDTLRWIEQQVEPSHSLLWELHGSLGEFPGLETKMRYGIPFYYGRSWVCYLQVVQQKEVELAFVYGRELMHTKALLDFKKRRMVGGLSWKPGETVDWGVVLAVLEEAMALDKSKKA